MEKISTKLFISILVLSVACGRDLEQAKRYADMKSECDSLITQANLVINVQKVKIDSLRKIKDDFLKVKAKRYAITAIDREISNSVEIESKIENVRKHLEAIKGFADNGEKALKDSYTLKGNI